MIKADQIYNMNYDEGAKELLNLSDIGKKTLIKYLFNKDIDISRATFTFGKNEDINQNEDGGFDKTIKDIAIVVNELYDDKNHIYRYHIEVETKYKTSNNLLVRMLKYAINGDLNIDNIENKTHIELPEQAIIILTPTTDMIQNILVIKENGKILLEKEYRIENLASEPINAFEDEELIMTPLKIYEIIPKVQN